MPGVAVPAQGEAYRRLPHAVSDRQERIGEQFETVPPLPVPPFQAEVGQRCGSAGRWGDMLDDSEILSIIKSISDRSLYKIGMSLVLEANMAGGKDNITVILLSF